MKKKLKINGQEIEIEILSKSKDSIAFIFNNQEYSFQLKKNDQGKVILQNQDLKNSIVYSSSQNLFDCESGQYKIEQVSRVSQNTQSEIENALYSPLPGKVIKISVKKGDQVKEGDELFRIEAMKMEHRICAPLNGTVKLINVKEGDSVTDGKLLGEVK